MSEQVFEKQHGGTFAKRCKHFDGLNYSDESKVCKAGVRMLDVIVKQPYRYKYAGRGEKAIYTSNDSMPCFRDCDPLGVCRCEKQEFPTAAEIEEHDTEIAGIFERSMKARTAIVEHLGGPWKRGTPGASGVIDCPVCGGKESLGFSRAGINGHIHARCKTEGCVAWME